MSDKILRHLLVTRNDDGKQTVVKCHNTPDEFLAAAPAGTDVTVTEIIEEARILQAVLKHKIALWDCIRQLEDALGDDIDGIDDYIGNVCTGLDEAPGINEVDVLYTILNGLRCQAGLPEQTIEQYTATTKPTTTQPKGITNDRV